MPLVNFMSLRRNIPLSRKQAEELVALGAIPKTNEQFKLETILTMSFLEQQYALSYPQ